MAPIPDIRDLLTYFAAEVMQFTIEYIGKIFGGFTPLVIGRVMVHLSGIGKSPGRRFIVDSNVYMYRSGGAGHRNSPGRTAASVNGKKLPNAHLGTY